MPSSDEICPECGSRMIWKKSKYGKMLACSNYPACRYIKPSEKKKVEYSDEVCPNCGSKMVWRNGRYGKFEACSNYPSCKYIKK